MSTTRGRIIEVGYCVVSEDRFCIDRDFRENDRHVLVKAGTEVVPLEKVSDHLVLVICIPDHRFVLIAPEYLRSI